MRWDEPGWYDRGGVIPAGAGQATGDPGERFVSAEESIRLGMEYAQRLYKKLAEEEDVT